MLVSRPTEIVTFHRKNADLPKMVVDFLREKDTFRKNHGNRQGFRQPWKSSRMFRVKAKTFEIFCDFVIFLHCSFFLFFLHFSSFLCFFIFFVHISHFLVFFIFPQPAAQEIFFMDSLVLSNNVTFFLWQRSSFPHDLFSNEVPQSFFAP